MDDKLNELRGQISTVDERIAKLLVQRMKLVVEVGKFKAVNNLPVLDKQREKRVLDHVTQVTTCAAYQHSLQEIYQVIMRQAKELEE